MQLRISFVLFVGIFLTLFSTANAGDEPTTQVDAVTDVDSPAGVEPVAKVEPVKGDLAKGQLAKGQLAKGQLAKRQSVTGNVVTDLESERSVVVDEIPKRVRVRLGEYRFGEAVKTTIVLKNESGMTLNIRAIDPDCGCLAVEPDRRTFKVGETIQLNLELAGAKKLTLVRRSIRILFNESTLPFILSVDVQVIGPVSLQRREMDIASTGQLIAIRGEKREVGLTIQGLESVRGAFRIVGEIQQDDETFRLEAKPTFSFGNASDLVRVTYRDASDQEKVVDLPVEFRVSDPIRFLPSTVSLVHTDQGWFAKTRMILSPRMVPIKIEQMQFVAESKDGGELKAEDCTVGVDPVSSVLSLVRIAIGEGHADSIPDRITVRDSQRNVLGTLYFTKTSGAE